MGFPSCCTLHCMGPTSISRVHHPMVPSWTGSPTHMMLCPAGQLQSDYCHAGSHYHIGTLPRRVSCPLLDSSWSMSGRRQSNGPTWSACVGGPASDLDSWLVKQNDSLVNVLRIYNNCEKSKYSSSVPNILSLKVEKPVWLFIFGQAYGHLNHNLGYKSDIIFNITIMRTQLLHT